MPTNLAIDDKMKGSDKPNLEKDKVLAELIGIILGDGHVHKRTEKSYLDSALVVSLNRIDEPEYVNYVKNIIYRVFNKNPRAHSRKESKSVDLRISGDKIS